MERITKHAGADKSDTGNMHLDERRIAQRFAVHIYIAVKQADKHLGHVINLSMNGMAVVGRIPLTPGQALSLHLEADLENGTRQLADLDAKCVFSVQHVRPGLLISGFEFQALTPKARLRLKNILRELVDSKGLAAS